MKNLSDRREKHVLALVKKALKSICPQIFIDCFNLNKDCIEKTTRQSNHIRLPRVQLESTKKAFFYHGGMVFLIKICSFVDF